MTDFDDADLQELVDRKRIYEVLTRYCRALDRCDVDLMKSVYWDDAQDDHGVFNGGAQEFADFIIREIQAWFDVTMHAIMNVHMELKDNIACTESYLFAYHLIRGERQKVEEIFGSTYLSGFDWSKVDSVPHVFWYGGRYVDRFEKRGKEWRIAHRQVVMDWNHNEISTGIWDEGMFKTLTLRGERGHGDAVFKNAP
ncbi:MAG: nuclear transport factor 2 family protein [Alphaproteobacteria bacterium]|nr:nuclear transport factor 2 family protein [Alphaproteobacteria bacterium]